jgi:tetratricopeptide (TPR) repeat protein
MNPGSETRIGRRRLVPWMWCLAVVLAVTAATTTWRSFQLSVKEQFLAAVVAVEQGEVAEARAIRRRLTRRGALDEARVLQGGILTHLSEWQAALSFLDASLAQGHLRRPLLLWAGQCLLQTGELGRAELVLRTLVTEFPDDSKAIRMLAITYYDLGAMHPALDCLNRLKILNSDDYRPHHLSGVIHLDFEQFAEAVSDFTEALSRRPPEPKRIQISQDLALAHVKLLEGLADSPGSLALEALCHLAQGNEAKAEECIRLGKSLNSSRETEPKLLKAESRLMSHRGNHESALSILKRLAELEPHNVETHHAISLVFGRLGRDAEQKAAIAKTGQIRELRKQLTELSNRANAAPYDVEVRIRLAAICEELGLQELSRSWRQAAQAIKNSAEWRVTESRVDEGS